jgi:hypothetical protein
MATTTARKYSVHAADDSVIAAFARKDRAIDEYATNKNAQYVTSPAGQVVHGSIAHNTEESNMTETTTTEAEATAKPKRERKPRAKVEGGCSLRRLTARAERLGFEVVNGGREGDVFKVALSNTANAGMHDFEGPSAREVYGYALAFLKGVEAEAKAAAAAAATAAA